LKKKTAAKNKPGVIRFTNAKLENFMANDALKKLISSKSIKSSDKFKIYRFVRRITDSPEAKAYVATKQEIINNHNEVQDKKPEKDREPLLMNDPKIKELLSVELDLAVAKIILEVKALPDELTVNDMIELSWFIDFNEE